MAEVSNSFLAVLLVIAILVAVVGAWTSIDKVNRLAGITGFGTTGFVNVTIANMTNLNVTATECNFGVGAVNASQTYAILASNGTITNWNASGTSTNMSIRNDGNQNVTINVTSGKNTMAFLGGGSTKLAYKIFAGQKDGAACITWPYQNANITYPGIEINATGYQICGNLSSADANDEMWVGCYLEISDNTPPGQKTDTWTFTATQV